MNATMTLKEVTAALLQITEANAKAKAAVHAHVYATHRETIPGLFGSDDITEDAKLNTLAECLAACESGDLSSLKGKAVNGQSNPKPETGRGSLALPVEVKVTKIEKVTPQQVLQHHVSGAIERGEAVPIAGQPVNPQHTANVMNMLAQAIRPHMPAGFDEARITTLVNDIIDKRLAAIREAIK